MFLCQVYWLSNGHAWRTLVKAACWASHGLPPRLHLPNTAAQCAICWLLLAGPWDGRFRNLLCTFMLNAGWVLSNLRPWGPRCVHSPSWRQVTAGCGCGPILPETPAGAPTGWTAWRCYCGDWWSWRRRPRRGLGCNALTEKNTRTVRFIHVGSQLLRPVTITVI